MLSPASTAASPTGSDPSISQEKPSVKDQLHKALKELVRLRLAEKDLRQKLESFDIENSSLSQTQTEVEQLRQEKMRLDQELSNHTQLCQAERERLQAELAKTKADLETALLREQELHALHQQLEQKIQEQRNTRALLVKHMRSEVAVILKVDELPSAVKSNLEVLVTKLELYEDIDCLPTVLVDKLSNVATMSRQLLDLNRGLEAYENQVKELTTSLSEQREREAELEVQLSEAKSTILRAAEKYKALEESHAGMESRLHQLNLEIVDLHKAHEDDLRNLKTLKLEIREVRLEKDMLKAALETAMCKANQQIEEELDKMQKDKEIMTQQIESLSTAKESLSAIVEQLTEENGDLKSRLNSACEKVAAITEEMNSSCHIPEHAQLDERVRSLINENDVLAVEISQLQQSANANDIVNQLKQQNEELIRQLRQREVDFEEQTRTLAEAEKQRNQLDSFLQVTDVEASQLKERLREAESVSEKSQLLADQYTEEANMLKGQVMDLTNQLSRLRDEMEQMSDASVTQSHEGTKKLEQKIEGLENDLSKTLADYNALKRSSEAIRDLLSVPIDQDVVQVIESCILSRQNMEKANEEYVAEIKKLRNSIQKNDSEIAQRLQAMILANESLERQVDDYASHCTNLEQTLSNLQEKVDQDEANNTQQINMLTKDLESTRFALDVKEKELVAIQSRHQDCASITNELQSRVLELEKQKRELQNEFDSVEQQLNDIKSNQDPARVWTFDNSLVKFVQDAAKESSTMAGVMLTKKCRGEEMVNMLKRACLYFAKQAQGIKDSEDLLKDELKKLNDKLVAVENEHRVTLREVDAKIHDRNVALHEYETECNNLKNRLQEEKEIYESKLNESNRLRERAEKEAADLHAAIAQMERAPATERATPARNEEEEVCAPKPRRATSPVRNEANRSNKPEKSSDLYR